MQNQKWPIVIQLYGDNELIHIANTEQLLPDKTPHQVRFQPQIK